MTKQVQRRRGTSTQHTSFTGAEGEISVNTTNKSIHVHDGLTAGGVEAARADMTNVSDANLNARLDGNTLSSLTITSADINGGTIDGTVIGGSSAAAGTFTTVTASGDVSVADKIVHTGDTNTAIRFPTADTVTVETAGSERMRIASNGRVGIGVTSIGANLEIGATLPTIRLRDSDGTNQYSDIQQTGGSLVIQPRNETSDGNILFRGFNGTVLTEYMRISTAGSVFNESGLDLDFRIESDTDTHAFFLQGSDGNIGIGTNSPGSKLSIVGLPTSSAGLSAGDIWNDGGTLKIV